MDRKKEVQKAVEISKEVYNTRSKDCGNIPPYALSAEAKALLILIAIAEDSLSNEIEIEGKVTIEIKRGHTQTYNGKLTITKESLLKQLSGKLLELKKISREEIEKILEQVLMKHHDDLSMQDEDAIIKATDAILSLVNGKE